jgi:hypothetical protein
MSSQSLKAANTEKATQLLNHVMGEIAPLDKFTNETLGRFVPEELWGRVTYREIMIRGLISKACGGDGKATQEVLDRLLGKPVQKNENLNLEASYTEFLDSIADKEEEMPTDKLVTTIKDEEADPLPIHQSVLSKRIEDLL